MHEKKLQERQELLLNKTFYQIHHDNELEDFLSLSDEMIEKYFLVDGSRYLDFKKYFDYIVYNENARRVHPGNQIIYDKIIQHGGYDRFFKNERFAYAALNAEKYTKVVRNTTRNMIKQDPFKTMGKILVQNGVSDDRKISYREVRIEELDSPSLDMYDNSSYYLVIEDKHNIQEYIYSKINKDLRESLDKKAAMDLNGADVYELIDYVSMNDFMINKSIQMNGSNYYNLLKKINYYMNNDEEINKSEKKKEVRNTIIQNGGPERFLNNSRFALTALNTDKYQEIEYKRKNHDMGTLFGEHYAWRSPDIQVRKISNPYEIRNFIYDRMPSKVKEFVNGRFIYLEQEKINEERMLRNKTFIQKLTIMLEQKMEQIRREKSEYRGTRTR